MRWPWTERRPLSQLPPPGFSSVSTANAQDPRLGVIMALPDPALLLTPQGQVLAANAFAIWLLDTDPIGHHISASIRAPAVLLAIAQVQADGQPRQVDYEVHGPLARHFEVYISQAVGAEISNSATLLVIKDLTREQQLERMRADFVANASHELRTPLASLSGFIETLLGAARHDEVAREKFLKLMRTQSERMKRLIDDLLSLSRIEMNATTKPSAHINLSLVVKHALDSLSQLARESHITLQADVPDLFVVGDWDELVQVLLNLIENAIKYSEPQTRVRIIGSSEGDMASLQVIDQGPGIAADHIPRLTERFYRINVQESRSRGGTGLGLAIVKHILNRHRGRLVITSVLGEGSSFQLLIPEFTE